VEESSVALLRDRLDQFHLDKNVRYSQLVKGLYMMLLKLHWSQVRIGVYLA